MLPTEGNNNNMDGHSEFQFRFTGQLTRASDSQDLAPDRSVVGRLSEERSAITEEIQLYLRDEIADELGVDADIHVNIRFQEGSVLFSGVIVIFGLLATISGAIDFVEKMFELIRRTLRWVLGRRAGGRLFHRSHDASARRFLEPSLWSYLPHSGGGDLRTEGDDHQ